MLLTTFSRALANSLRVKLASLVAGEPSIAVRIVVKAISAVARSLVRERGFNARAVASAYLAWRQSGPFDIGGTTTSGITALAAGRAARSDSQSNGGLMRVSPIGIFAAGDPALAARLGAEDATLTHPDPVCRAAGAA